VGSDLEWSLQTIAIKDLSAFPNNPRKLTKQQYEQLKISISKYQLIDKPIVNADNTIIGGHQRIEVMKRMGFKEVACWVPNRLLLEPEVAELNIRLNKATGDWDFDILANNWDFDDLLDWGFTQEELGADKPYKDEVTDAEKAEEANCCPACGHCW
jgi:site-specific DNA-methyltransferase (adenine-specific)